MTDHPPYPPGDPSNAAVSAVLAGNRIELVRFFALRLGSSAAGEELVFQIDAALAEGRFRRSGDDDLASLFRFGSQLLAAQRGCERAGAVTLRLAGTGSEAAAQFEPHHHRAMAVIGRLSDLSPDALLVLRLRKLEGCSFLTVAEVLDISVEQVEERLRLALQQLTERSPGMGVSDAPSVQTVAISSAPSDEEQTERCDCHPAPNPAVTAKPKHRR